MKKIATLTSAVVLTATSLSAGAWWGPCMTQEQQQAMAQQQTKAREQIMAAQRAEMAKRIQTQGVDPMTMGFPGTLDPLGIPLGIIDPWGAASPWNDMGMPEYPTMPAMPEPPSMLAMPEPFSLEMPQPPIPSFMRDRYAELEAYRSQVIKKSKARRDKMTKEIAERRRELQANRRTRPHHYGRPFGSPYPRMTTPPEIPTSAPETASAEKAPDQVAGTTSAPEATTPTPVTATAQATVTPAPAAPITPTTLVPASETAPVAPAPVTPTPQD